MSLLALCRQGAPVSDEEADCETSVGLVRPREPGGPLLTTSNGNTRNRALYREVNLRIREVTESFGADGHPRFLCECGSADCTATFELTKAQFDGLLSDPSRALLSARHRASMTGETVIAEYDRFVVVAADSAS